MKKVDLASRWAGKEYFDLNISRVFWHKTDGWLLFWREEKEVCSLAQCSLTQKRWISRSNCKHRASDFFKLWEKRCCFVVMITSEGWRGRSKGLWRCWVSASPAVSGCLGSYSWHLITNHWSSSSSSLITDHHYHHCGYQWVSGDITHPSLLLILSPDVSLSLYQITSSHPWHKLWKKVQASRIL